MVVSAVVLVVLVVFIAANGRLPPPLWYQPPKENFSQSGHYMHGATAATATDPVPGWVGELARNGMCVYS